MKVPVTHYFAIRQIQGFAVYVLCNDEVEVVVVPELGAKIISLRDLRTGREWMWHPGTALKLFKNQPGDAFSASPLAGMDECLPTISPAEWRGRQLSDHGEVWQRGWETDPDAWRQGRLISSIRLETLPLWFERTLELQGNEVRLRYRLRNRGDTPESFAWTAHPLLRLAAGDELELPVSTRRQLPGKSWICTLSTVLPDDKCAKVFVHPVHDGWAALLNPTSGDRLEMAWDPAENNTLGLWLSRGGWHGHHHFAMEVTNAGDDSLAVAAGRGQCGVIAAHGEVSWQLVLKIGVHRIWKPPAPINEEYHRNQPNL